MIVRKTKKDRSVRKTQPVVLPVKQKESLSYMNSREFTYIIIKINKYIYSSHISVLIKHDINFIRNPYIFLIIASTQEIWNQSLGLL